MLTALTCEREMLTFPLPARIKTLARDPLGNAAFMLYLFLATQDLQFLSETLQGKFPCEKGVHDVCKS